MISDASIRQCVSKREIEVDMINLLDKSPTNEREVEAIEHCDRHDSSECSEATSPANSFEDTTSQRATPEYLGVEGRGSEGGKNPNFNEILLNFDFLSFPSYP